MSMMNIVGEALIGKTIGDRYVIEEILGSGNVGLVLGATQLSVDRRVAIKILRDDHEDHETIRQRFEREARALARLEHPACVTLFDFGRSEELGAYYMVMERVEGTTLAEKMRRGVGSLSQALGWIACVCEGVAHAHERGVLHRDLKPANIMLTGTTERPVKVLDFGLARICEATRGDLVRLSRTGELYGTPAYMSPEQCKAEQELTVATDVYAIGVMLFELCTGHIPFQSDSLMGMLLEHINTPAPILDRERFTTELSELVEAMLAKDPDARPQSLDEVAAKLRELAAMTEDKEIELSPARAPFPLSDTIIEESVAMRCASVRDGAAACPEHLVRCDEDEVFLDYRETLPQTDFVLEELLCTIPTLSKPLLFQEELDQEDDTSSLLTVAGLPSYKRGALSGLALALTVFFGVGSVYVANAFHVSEDPMHAAMAANVAAANTSGVLAEPEPIRLEPTVIRADAEEDSRETASPTRKSVKPRSQPSRKPTVKKVLDNPVRHFRNRFQRARERAYGDR